MFFPDAVSEDEEDDRRGIADNGIPGSGGWLCAGGGCFSSGESASGTDASGGNREPGKTD